MPAPGQVGADLDRVAELVGQPLDVRRCGRRTARPRASARRLVTARARGCRRRAAAGSRRSRPSPGTGCRRRRGCPLETCGVAALAGALLEHADDQVGVLGCAQRGRSPRRRRRRRRRRRPRRSPPRRPRVEARRRRTSAGRVDRARGGWAWWKPGAGGTEPGRPVLAGPQLGHARRRCRASRAPGRRRRGVTPWSARNTLSGPSPGTMTLAPAAMACRAATVERVEQRPRVGVRRHDVGELRVDLRDRADQLVEPVVAQVPPQLRLERGDEVHDADAVTEGRGHQHRRLAEGDDRDVDQRADLLVAGVRDGGDEERVVAPRPAPAARPRRTAPCAARRGRRSRCGCRGSPTGRYPAPCRAGRSWCPWPPAPRGAVATRPGSAARRRGR